MCTWTRTPFDEQDALFAHAYVLSVASLARVTCHIQFVWMSHVFVCCTEGSMLLKATPCGRRSAQPAPLLTQRRLVLLDSGSDVHMCSAEFSSPP
eukprot:1998526-Amphidinium_carterae.1